MVSETFLQEEEVFSWAGRKKNGEAWPGPGAPFYGDTSEAETFRTVAPGKAVVALVCMKDAARTAQAVDALSRSRPEVKVLVTTTDGELDHLVRDNLRKVSWADMVGDRLETEIARLRTLERVQALRDMLDSADDVALLLQPDPDPDGIASALALRQVLRRNRATAPIVTFGGVARPENVAMLELLEIDLEVIRPEDLGALRRRRPAGRAAQRVPRRPSRRRRRHRPSSRAEGVPGALPRHPRVLRRHLDHPHRVLPGRGGGHPAAAGHRAAVRDQERHPVPGPRDLAGRRRRVFAPLPAGEHQPPAAHREAGAAAQRLCRVRAAPCATST